MTPLVIFGCTEFAQVAKCYLDAESPYRVVAFTVDRPYRREPTLLGLDVVPFDELARSYPPSACRLFVAIGYRRVNRGRSEVYERCKQAGYSLATYISPRANTCGPYSIGENCFVFEGNVIQPFVSIGNGVILWTGNQIGHHATVEDHCFIAGHVMVAGGARIGHHTFVGVNATVIDRVRVAPENIIGAGALITRDTRDREVYRPRHTEPALVSSDKLWK